MAVPFLLFGITSVDVPAASGIAATGIVIYSARIDPLLMLKPEGATIRALRLAGRQARKRLRGG